MTRFVSSPYSCLALLALLFGVSCYLFWYQPLQNHLLDYSIYYEAGTRLAEGRNIYVHDYKHLAHDGREFELVYLYPPFLAGFFASVSSIGPETAKILWCSFSFLCVWSSIFTLTFVFQKLSPYQLTWLQSNSFIAALVVCFEPLYWGMMMGQVDSLVLLCLCTFSLFLTTKTSYFCGVAASIAAMLKMSPVLLVLLLVQFRKWKDLVAFTGMLALCSLGFVLLFGLAPLRDFVSAFGSISSGTALEGFVFNYSGIPLLLDVLPFEKRSLEYSVSNIFLLVCLVALLILFLRRSNLKIVERNEIKSVRQLGIVICFMLLLSPILWFHHLIWCLLPILALLCEKVEGERERFRHWTICAGFVFVFTQANLFHYQLLLHFPWAKGLTSFAPTLAILLLAFRLTYSARRRET